MSARDERDATAGEWRDETDDSMPLPDAAALHATTREPVVDEPVGTDASPHAPERSLDERLAALSALALALHHDDAGPLGGFWPDAVSLEGEELRIALDRTVSSSERFAARLSRADTLRDAAYMAPEIASDREAAHGHAADAYSFAAMVYVEATGQAPVGRLDVGRLQNALGPRRFARVLDGLSSDPLARPTLKELAHAIKAPPAHVAAAVAAARPAQKRGPIGTRVDDDESHAEMVREESQSFVRPLLMVGAVSVFTGALWFIWLAWGLLTDVPRLFLVVGFTASIGWSSEALARYTFDEAAKTLRVLFTQLFWAVGGMVLAVAGALKSQFGWALVALVVACVSGVVAEKRGPRALLFVLTALSTLLAGLLIYVDLGEWGRVAFFVGLSALARLALFMGEGLRLDVRGIVGTAHVFANAACAAHATWALFPSGATRLFTSSGAPTLNPDNLWRFVIIVVVIGIAWGVSRQFTYATKMPALTGVLNVLLAFGLVPLVFFTWESGATTFALVPPLVALVEAGIALRLLGAPRATLAWFTFSTSLWLLGVALLADIRWLTSPNVAILGAIVWAVTVVLARVDRSALLAAASTVHFAIAAMALGEHLSTGSEYGPTLWLFAISVAYIVLGVVVLRFDDNLRVAHTAAAGLFAAGSTMLALGVFAHASEWTDAARFGALFAYVPFAVFVPLLVDRKDASRLLAAAALVVLFALPGVELLLFSSSRALSLIAMATGITGVALGILVVTPERAERFLGDHAEAFLSFFVLVATATALAPSLIGATHIIGKSLGDVVEHTMLVVMPLGALFGLGMGAERLERSREGRLLELVAAAVFLGVFTLASFAKTQDYGHPSLLILGGVVLLVLGTRARHPHVVFLSSSALIVCFWTQFFMKLYSHAPTSLLLIVFGIAVLVGGVLYEKHVKALVTNMRSWPRL